MSFALSSAQPPCTPCCGVQKLAWLGPLERAAFCRIDIISFKAPQLDLTKLSRSLQNFSNLGLINWVLSSSLSGTRYCWCQRACIPFFNLVFLSFSFASLPTMPETRSLRQRKATAASAGTDSDTPSTTSSPEKKKKILTPKAPEKRLKDEDDYSPWVDIARVLTFLLVASCTLSYVISGGESMFWGQKEKPKLLRPSWWKSHFVRLPLVFPSPTLPFPFEPPTASSNYGASFANKRPAMQ